MSKLFGRKANEENDNDDSKYGALNVSGIEHKISEVSNDSDGREEVDGQEEVGSQEEVDGQEKVGSQEEVDNQEELEDQNEETIEKKKRHKKKRKKKKEMPKDVNIVKELLSLIIYIGAIVLLCYFIITFVGCRARVDGNSMNPTLQNNDSLWVDKISYEISDPKRFDVIIFDYDENTDYVKRIIGLPGEKVRIDQDGNIYIDDELLEENYGSERILSTNLGRASQTIILDSDEYFVLGDNRNNSSDSRYADVGNVKRDDIVGKVRLRIYPFKSIGFIN